MKEFIWSILLFRMSYQHLDDASKQAAKRGFRDGFSSFAGSFFGLTLGVLVGGGAAYLVASLLGYV